MSGSAIPLPGPVKIILPLQLFLLSGPDIPSPLSPEEASKHPLSQSARTPRSSPSPSTGSAHLDLSSQPVKSEVFIKYRIQLISLHYQYRKALIEHEVTTRRVADELADHPAERSAALSELERKHQKCLLIMQKFENDIAGLTEAIQEEKTKEEKAKEEKAKQGKKKADDAINTKNELEVELKLKLQAMALVDDDKDEEEGGVPLQAGYEY
ncbi:uncharacterized protein LAJ45_03654 [Morchella importuna]|uniref:uncharacterized protein n=1 Tax=Morchella importuna TaxID=1174673 RepID=UPI001E8DCC92|nr:uncharacterized protein LAJ45_03654 [Morchella importuna]KAH8152228.1 hypothetical protein LAJ45_03654 [Morchella importuna]